MSTMSTTLLDEYHALLVAAAAAAAKDSGNSNSHEDDDDDDDGDTRPNPLEIATLSFSQNYDNAQKQLLPIITASDTLVVVDMQYDFLPGGAFGVDEGDAVIEGICDLIRKFHDAGGTVIASRDYHPSDHCSFAEYGGPFPPHCIMGTRGSFLHARIAETLEQALAAEKEDDDEPIDDNRRCTRTRRTHVVYKGFDKRVESFGGFQYDVSNDQWKTRLSHTAEDAVEWTGAWALKASNLASDANAAPDIMSILDKTRSSTLLPPAPSSSDVGDGGEHEPAGTTTRVFCCGLAYDYCVIDTAVNYVQSVHNHKKNTNNNDANNNTNNNNANKACFVVHDLTRAARVPGLGTFGSGFLTDPRVMLETLDANNIGLVRFVD